MNLALSKPGRVLSFLLGLCPINPEQGCDGPIPINEHPSGPTIPLLKEDYNQNQSLTHNDVEGSFGISHAVVSFRGGIHFSLRKTKLTK